MADEEGQQTSSDNNKFSPEFSNSKSFKRLNHNRPREISSKKPVTMFRNIFQVRKQEFVDPRFSAAMGEYRPEVFRKQYSFVTDMRKREIEVIFFLQPETLKLFSFLADTEKFRRKNLIALIV